MLEALCYMAAFVLFVIAAILPPPRNPRWFMLTNAGLALAVLPSAVHAFQR